MSSVQERTVLLVVSRDSNVRRVLRREGAAWGCAVVTAPDATSAATKLQEASGIGCVLVDLDLGGDCGIEFLEASAARRPELHSRFVLQGRGPRPDRLPDCVPFLAKPVSLRLVRSVVEEVLQRPLGRGHSQALERPIESAEGP